RFDRIGSLVEDLPMKLCRPLMALAICGAVLGGIPATAQDYPRRPLHLIVPYAAGGTADGIARIISKHLGTSLGQTVVIDNRGGAGGLIGAAGLTQSPADGYTIGVLATPHAATPLDRDSGFDRAGVKAVALLAVVPGLLCVHGSGAASSLSDVVDLARAKPGRLTYGNPGNFTAGHLAMEMLKAQIARRHHLRALSRRRAGPAGPRGRPNSDEHQRALEFPAVHRKRTTSRHCFDRPEAVHGRAERADILGKRNVRVRIERVVRDLRAEQHAAGTGGAAQSRHCPGACPTGCSRVLHHHWCGAPEHVSRRI